MIAALALAIATGVPASRTEDPLAPARRGLVQCRDAHTDGSCQSIVRYAPQADGSYRSFGRLRLAGDPDYIVEIEATVWVEDGLVCDHDYAESGRSARLLVDGVPASAAMAGAFRVQFEPHWRQFDGKRVCGAYTRSGGGWSSALWVDGVIDESTRGTIAWVMPDQARLAEARADEGTPTRHQAHN